MRVAMEGVIEQALNEHQPVVAIVWPRQPVDCSCQPDADDADNGPNYRAHAAREIAFALEQWLREVKADAVDEFVQRIATHHAYNGADDDGQMFYNEGINTWLPRLALAYRQELQS